MRIRSALGLAERRKDEFMAILAHELRNSLAPMRSALQLANVIRSMDELAKPLGILERQIEHMTNLVSDLADIGSVALGSVELVLAPCDLREAVSRATEIAQPSIEVRSQQFSETLPNDPVSTVADVRRVIQAVSNLLLNASKYTPAGGCISIKLSTNEGFAVIEVADDGIGIAQDRLADIFELFSQIESARQHAQGGLGVGLAVARRIAELHGGSIGVQSDGPGRGSVFGIRLPLSPTVHSPARH